MKATIRKLEQQLADRDRQIHKQTLEINSLKNLIRSQTECRETHEARAIVGPRRWEDQIESENDVEPSQSPLYLSSMERVDLSNGARKRMYEGRRNQADAGLTNVFPLEVD